MDDRHFDGLARWFSGATDRRAGLKAALGGMIGLAGAAAIGTARVEPAFGKKKKKKKKKGNGPCGNGSTKANRCQAASDCCTGTCVKSQCQYKTAGEFCASATQCSPGLSCTGGVCTACTAETCASGCCDGMQCRPGTSPAACGLPGTTCAECGNNEVCENGSCVGGAGFACTSNAACGDGFCSNGECVRTCPSGCGLSYCEQFAISEIPGSEGSAPGTFYAPSHLAITADGSTLYIADSGNDRVQALDGFTFGFKAQFGCEFEGESRCQGGSGNDRLSRPVSVVLSRNESELFVLDSQNNRVQVLDASTLAFLRSIALALPSGISNVDWQAVEIDPVSGDVFIGFSYDNGVNYVPQIDRYPAAGGAATDTWAPSFAERLGDIAFSPDGGLLYVSSESIVQVYTPDGTLQPGGHGSGASTCTTTDGFRYVQALQFDQDGFLWVADKSCKRVSRFNVSSAPWTILDVFYRGEGLYASGVAIRPDGVVFVSVDTSNDESVKVLCPTANAGNGVWPRLMETEKQIDAARGEKSEARKGGKRRKGGRGKRSRS